MYKKYTKSLCSRKPLNEKVQYFSFTETHSKIPAYGTPRTLEWALSVWLSTFGHVRLEWIPANSNLIPEDVHSSFGLCKVPIHSVPPGFSVSGRIFLHLNKYGQQKLIVVRCYVSEGECVTISTQSFSKSFSLSCLTLSSSSN